MSAVYFDANVVAKLVLDERESEIADEVWRQAETRHASPLTYVEAAAAVAAAHRNHQIDTVGNAVAREDIEVIRGQLRAVQLTERVATRAAQLAREHALKGADAVHLASALALDDPMLVFATWDRRLHAAAQQVGLRVAPPALAG